MLSFDSFRWWCVCLKTPFLVVVVVVTFLLIVPFLVVLDTLLSCLPPLDQESIRSAALTFKVQSINQSINKLYLFSNLQSSTQVLIYDLIWENVH